SRSIVTTADEDSAIGEKNHDAVKVRVRHWSDASPNLRRRLVSLCTSQDPNAVESSRNQDPTITQGNDQGTLPRLSHFSSHDPALCRGGRAQQRKDHQAQKES